VAARGLGTASCEASQARGQVEPFRFHHLERGAQEWPLELVWAPLVLPAPLVAPLAPLVPLVAPLAPLVPLAPLAPRALVQSR
jgi:hypothetical protein